MDKRVRDGDVGEEAELKSEGMEGLTERESSGELGGGDYAGEGAGTRADPDGMRVVAKEGENGEGGGKAYEGFDEDVGGEGVGAGEGGVEDDGVGE